METWTPFSVVSLSGRSSVPTVPASISNGVQVLVAEVQQMGCFILAGLSAGDDDDPVVKKQRQRAVEA